MNNTVKPAGGIKRDVIKTQYKKRNSEIKLTHIIPGIRCEKKFYNIFVKMIDPEIMNQSQFIRFLIKKEYERRRRLAQAQTSTDMITTRTFGKRYKKIYGQAGKIFDSGELNG